MRKSIIVLLVIAFLLGGLFILTGCGNEQKETTAPTVTIAPTVTVAPTATATATETSTDTSDVEPEYEMTSTRNENTLIVKITAEGLDYTKLPWVGIIPVGEYANEEEADEYDVTYTYIDEENYPNIELNVDEIEEGEWLIVLCDSDDEGNILATAPITL